MLFRLREGRSCPDPARCSVGAGNNSGSGVAAARVGDYRKSCAYPGRDRGNMSKSHSPFPDKIGLVEHNNAFLRYNCGSSTRHTRRGG